MSTERYELMAQALHRAGFRLTQQRLAICRHLADNHSHPAPGEVYKQVHKQFPTLSLATVYNTLTVLRELGLIIEIPGGAEGVRYETNLEPHVNLICQRCGAITDLPLDSVLAIRDDISEKADFELRSLRIDAFGLCKNCRLAQMDDKNDD